MVCTARDPPPLWSSLLSSLLSLHFGLHTFSLLSLWSPFFPFYRFSPLCPLVFFFILGVFSYSILSFFCLLFFPFFILCLLFFPFFFAINATIVVRCAYVKEENFGVFTFSI